MGNAPDEITHKIDDKLEASTSRKVRMVLSDAFAFVKSREANAALATVTFEQLMGEQILRNGESEKSSAAKYDPYRYKPDEPLPAGVEPGKRANFAGGADTGRPTKIDMIMALKNQIDGVVDDVLGKELVDVADLEEYSEDKPTVDDEGILA